jgi:hypothetical protein
MSITQEELDEMLERNPDLKRVQADSVVAWQAIPIDVVAQIKGAQRKNKYNVSAKEDRTYGGHLYPSKKQMKEAITLDLERKAGKIKGYIEEVPFRLPGHSVHRIDFGIIELDNTVTWREVKGRDLPMGKLKRKQVEELYHIKIEVV